jgi:dTDP-4-dehydrorhamnose 3,5-epimerase
MNIQFKPGSIEGVRVQDLVVHRDARGWLIELFRSDELDPQFLPAMSYVSSTKPGVARGPHEHRDQADLFCFVGPSTFRLYLWDARKDSPTFGHKLVLETGASKPLAVVIPPGVVHAYKNVGMEDGWVLNFPNRLYAGTGRKEPVDEIRHEGIPDSPFVLEEGS